MKTMSMRSWDARETALWLGLFVGLSLPALFHVGYRIFDLELWITIFVLLVLAQLTAIVPRFIACVIAAFVLASTVHVHYLPGLSFWSGVGLVAGCLTMAALSLRGLLGAGASGGVAATVFSAMTGSSLWVSEGEYPHESGNGPAVIHIVLDEQAAPGGLPQGVVPQHEIREATDWFVRRGFTTFERSFSQYGITTKALALLANADRAQLDLKTTTQAIPGSTNSALITASAFAAVARQRPIRAVTSTFLDIRPALKILPRATRSAAYSPGAPSPTMAVLRASVGDRLLIMRAITISWLINQQKVELLLQWGKKSPAVKEFLSNDVHWRLHPATSMLVIDRLIDIEAPRLRRGQYLFAHVLLPHYPYVFTRSCRLRPVTTWRNRIVSSGAAGVERDTLASRAERYQLYTEQAACTRLKLERLLAAIETNPYLHDAVVLFHGDHGARIAIEDRSALAGIGYTEADYLRDWHAAFFAVRLPGRTGRLVTTPHAIHDLFATLIQNDFASLPTATLPRSPLGARIYPEVDPKRGIER